MADIRSSRSPCGSPPPDPRGLHGLGFRATGLGLRRSCRQGCVRHRSVRSGGAGRAGGARPRLRLARGYSRRDRRLGRNPPCRDGRVHAGPLCVDRRRRRRAPRPDDLRPVPAGYLGRRQGRHPQRRDRFRVQDRVRRSENLRLLDDAQRVRHCRRARVAARRTGGALRVCGWRPDGVAAVGQRAMDRAHGRDGGGGRRGRNPPDRRRGSRLERGGTRRGRPGDPQHPGQCERCSLARRLHSLRRRPGRRVRQVRVRSLGKPHPGRLPRPGPCRGCGRIREAGHPIRTRVTIPRTPLSGTHR